MDLCSFFVKPTIPDSLNPLCEIAMNVWSCWDKDAQRLFHRINPQLFREHNHSPIDVLFNVGEMRLNEIAQDEGFIYEVNSVYDKFKRYMNFEGVYKENGETKPFSSDDVIVYLCMEYGLHESIPGYSGGLGILAGDHLKAASDIGCNMVSFGLKYGVGYFGQQISVDGTQVEEYQDQQWYLRAISEVFNDDQTPLIIEVPLKKDIIYAKVWKIQVGRVPLYLLDTNIQKNKPEHRYITSRLYDSDRRVRLEQELLVGRGSIIAMNALGITPKVYHLNEGHTAFSIFERLLSLTKKGYSMEEAKLTIQYSTVFTTHTPVIAGNESFDDELIQDYLAPVANELHISMNDLLCFGKVNTEKIEMVSDDKKTKKIVFKDASFSLSALALQFSRKANAVSELHAEVSRGMWKGLYPNRHTTEYPIEGVTNGVHIQSWLSLQLAELFDRYVGPDYLHNAESDSLWEKVDTIPDNEIWNAHRRRKEQNVSFIRRRLRKMAKHRGIGKGKRMDISSILNPEYLTIGFARRFAAYKRANLIFMDPERLAAILTNPERPVQLVFAGKAHPADGIGKDLIKRIFQFINDYPVENHVVFVEDYDINIGRHLVQGVDVWLNNPRKPMEASGTSGMKAGINGVLNFSVLDGWWPEAYDGSNGWAINAGEECCNNDIADEAEANQIYELLENDITSTYYDRGEGDVPTKWISMMKRSIATVSSGFNMHRAVRDYLYRFYLPQMDMASRITHNKGELLKRLLAHKELIDRYWSDVHIRDFFPILDEKSLHTEGHLVIDSYVFTGDTDMSLFNVELFYQYGAGLNDYKYMPMTYVETYDDKVAKYNIELDIKGSGLQETGVRIVPNDALFHHVFPEYVKWKG